MEQLNSHHGKKIKMTTPQIDEIFTYHIPKEGQSKKYDEIRNEARLLAHKINDLCPESREKSLAITKLQEMVMFANASIAIHT